MTSGLVRDGFCRLSMMFCIGDIHYRDLVASNGGSMNSTPILNATLDPHIDAAICSYSSKIDIFLQEIIFSQFNPENIHWWISLSGGKDSFGMANALREWYTSRNLAF